MGFGSGSPGSVGSGSGLTVIDLGGNLGAAKTVATAGDSVHARGGILNANCAITTTQKPAGEARWIKISGVQDATGGRTLTVDGVAVSIPTAAGAGWEVIIDWDGTDSFVYFPGGSGVQGPPGPTGATGASGATGATGASGTNGAISVIEDEGTPLAVRSNVNFAGAGVTATDAGGKTVVTIPGGGAVVDADATTKGIVQLAGDLAGTATSPSVAKVKGKTVPTPGASEDQMTWKYDHASGAMVWTALGGSTPDASTSTKGVTTMSVAPASAANPIAVGSNDPRMTDQRLPSQGDWTPQMNGLLAANFDPLLMSNGRVIDSGFAYFFKLWLPVASLHGNIHCYVNTAGSGLTFAKAAVYVPGGVMLGRSGDLTGSGSGGMSSAGFKTFALTAESGQSLPTGGPNVFVKVGFLCIGTTCPNIRMVTSLPENMNMNLTGGANLRMAHNGGGSTDLPATDTGVNPVSNFYWVGMS